MQDTDILFNARTGRYRDVYPCNSRSKGWQAIIKVNESMLYLGAGATPQEAAVLVVKWYRKKYGFLWKRVLQHPCTRRTPFSIMRVRRYGYRVNVYVAGTPVLVTPYVLEFGSDHPDWEGWDKITGYWKTRRWGIYAMRMFINKWKGVEAEKEMSVLFRVDN